MDTQPAPIDAKPIKRRSISRKVEAALRHRVEQGTTWKAAAEAAGLSEAGIHKARLQPHVKQRLEEIKGDYIQEVEALKAPHKARAMEVARELLEGAKSEAVKARMVEFLAGESKGMSVNVGVQVNNQPPANGYEFVRPGQEVVQIRAAQDTQSGADVSQASDIIDHVPSRASSD